MKLLLYVTIFLILPLNQYAAFPLKLAHRQDSTSLSSASNTVSAQKTDRQPEKRYNNTAAIILAVIGLLYGVLGLHRFLLGYTGEGVLQLLGSLSGLLSMLLFFGAVIGGAYLLLIPAAVCLVYAAAMWIWQLVDLVRICQHTLLPRRMMMRPLRTIDRQPRR